MVISNTFKSRLTTTKSRLTTTGLIIVALLSPAAVFAFDSPFIGLADKLSGGLVGEVLGLYNEVKGYVEDIINSDGRDILELVLNQAIGDCNGNNNGGDNICGKITADGSVLAKILESAKGELNIPAPLDYGKAVRYELDSNNQFPSWGYYGNQWQVQRLATNAGDREVTALFADTLLGDGGQKKVSQSLERAAEVTQSVLQTGEEALGAESTQDAVKILAWANAQQAILTQQQVKDGQMSRVDSQITNLNLSNISDTLDQQRSDRYVKERIDSEALTNAAMRAGLF
ncbi:MAG: hypothetical protein N5P05_002701 [Chroococcopsis gigantea SAG 12.99]|nr:hypothetical protein [Chlorogloea purpurea SAG 13.99]MDV3001095.1 hypothetical protein [Chroococcopsis gigantea SAG 12.99]